MPAPQGMHTLDALAPIIVEYFPAPQFKQVAVDDAPIDSEYLPASHKEHAFSAVAPVLPEYLPTPQPVQLSFDAAPDDA